MSGEAERRLAELQAALEADDPDASALERAGQRVAAALASLSRETPQRDLSRLIDLHGVVRESAARLRTATGRELHQMQADRERLSHLTRPDDSASALDLRA